MPRESVAERIEKGQRRLLSIDRKVYEHIAALEKLRKERSRIWRSINALKAEHPRARGAKAASMARAAPPAVEPEVPRTFGVRIGAAPQEPVQASLVEHEGLNQMPPAKTPPPLTRKSVSKEQDREAKMKQLERARQKAGIKPGAHRKRGGSKK